MIAGGASVAATSATRFGATIGTPLGIDNCVIFSWTLMTAAATFASCSAIRTSSWLDYDVGAYGAFVATTPAVRCCSAIYTSGHNYFSLKFLETKCSTNYMESKFSKCLIFRLTTEEPV